MTEATAPPGQTRLRIATLNVQGIRRKLTRVISSATFDQIDVLLLQELCLNDSAIRAVTNKFERQGSTFTPPPPLAPRELCGPMLDSR